MSERATVPEVRVVLQPAVQCSECLRRVGRTRCAIMPEGAAALCSICGAIGEVQSAVRTSETTLAEEDEILELLSRAYSVLWRSQGRSPR